MRGYQKYKPCLLFLRILSVFLRSDRWKLPCNIFFESSQVSFLHVYLYPFRFKPVLRFVRCYELTEFVILNCFLCLLFDPSWSLHRLEDGFTSPHLVRHFFSSPRFSSCWWFEIMLGWWNIPFPRELVGRSVAGSGASYVICFGVATESGIWNRLSGCT